MIIQHDDNGEILREIRGNYDPDKNKAIPKKSENNVIELPDQKTRGMKIDVETEELIEKPEKTDSSTNTTQ